MFFVERLFSSRRVLYWMFSSIPTGNDFGGGFGFFGGQQESTGSSSFGAGFSFGTSSSQQNNSGMYHAL